MGYELPFTTVIADIYIEQFSDIYDSVRINADKIRTELATEEGKFSKTLKDGVREFEKIVNGFKIALERIPTRDDGRTRERELTHCRCRGVHSRIREASRALSYGLSWQVRRRTR
jgi:hypothetical protein